MAIEPIEGFYLYDEKTDSDGVAKIATKGVVFGNEVSLEDELIAKEKVTYTNSGYINTSGNVVTNANFKYSSLLPVDDLDRNVSIYWHGHVATFSFYDEEENFLSYYKHDATGTNVEADYVDVPSGAVYVRVCTDPSYNNEVYRYVDKYTTDDTVVNILKDETKVPDLAPLSNYDRDAGADLYCSNRVIPSGSYITDISLLTRSDGAVNIYVIDNDTGEVLYKKNVSVVGGEFEKHNVSYYTASDAIIGVESAMSSGTVGLTYYFSEEYSFSTDGLYQATPRNPSVGDTVTISKVSTSLFAFACQFTYKTIFADMYERIDNGVSTAEQYADELVSTYILDNGNLLHYEEIAESVGFVGRWFDYNGKKCTNNDGAELYFKVKGTTSVDVNFGQITVQAVTPYIAYSVDGGEFTRQQISQATISLPDNNEHIIRIVVDGMTEAQGGNKWANTIGIYLNSVDAGSGTVTGIVPTNKVGMFFGDSITEGINALATGATAEQNSATNSYPFFCCQYLNAVSHRVGYGASGLTLNGSFHPCIDAIDYYYDGAETPTTYPDFIVVNHGVNDRGVGASEETYITAYKEVIDRLRVKYSSTPIFCVVPFKSVQPYSSAIEEMCDEYSNTYFVSSSGWNGATTDATHLSVAGAKNNGRKLADAILKVLGKGFFE